MELFIMGHYWKTMPIEERIAVRLRSNGECREWTGGTNGARKREQRRPYMKKGYVSRIVWELAHGPIPSGVEVCHRCDNPLCLRTSHLFLGTHIENMRDMDLKGRRFTPIGEKSGSAKLSEEQVREIRVLYGSQSFPMLAKRYNVSLYTVWAVVRRKKWKHIV